MTLLPAAPLPPVPSRRLRRPVLAAAALAALAALAAGVLLATLHGSPPSSTSSETALRGAVAAVAGALKAEQAEGHALPGSLEAVGSAVRDATTGERIAALPAGVRLAYERSVDGTRFVLTLTDAGASAAYDSAATASRG